MFFRKFDIKNRLVMMLNRCFITISFIYICVCLSSLFDRSKKIKKGKFLHEVFLFASPLSTFHYQSNVRSYKGFI